MANDIANRLVVAILSLMACWIAIWYLVYLVTGFHLRYIGINNGVYFSRITFQTRRFNVYLGCLRIRLWGNSRMIILDDLTVNLKRTAGGSSKSSKSNTNEVLTFFPSNWLGKKLMRFVLKRIPSISLELRHMEFLPSPKHTVILEYVKFNLNTRLSRRYSERLKFYTNLSTSRLIHSVLRLEKSTELTNWSTIKLQFNFLVALENGEMKSIRQKLSVDDVNLLVFNLVNLMLQEHLESCAGACKLNTDPPTESSFSKSKRLYKAVHSIMSESALQIENLTLLQIPFATLDDNQNFADYFQSFMPRSSLEINVKSILFNFAKLYDDSAGFEILFDPQYDEPFHLSGSVQLLALSSSVLSEDTDFSTKDTDELLNIPNVSFTCKTNILDRLAKGDGFKDCAMEFFSSASSPILDLDVNQLSEVFYNVVLLKKYLTLEKIRSTEHDHELVGQSSSYDLTDGDDTKVDTGDEESIELKNKKLNLDDGRESLKRKFISLLNEYFPSLDMKVIIEQPRFIVRFNNEKESKNHLLNFSYSLLNFHFLTTDEREYSGKCDILNPSIIYQEKESNESFSRGREKLRKEVFKIKTLLINLHVFNDLSVRPVLDVNDVMINLIHLNTLAGISSVINAFSEKAEECLLIGVLNQSFNKELLKFKNSRSRINSTYKAPLTEVIFRLLPGWLLEFTVKFSVVEIFVGSRSILIPSELVSNSSKSDLSTDINSDNGNLRKIKLSMQEFILHTQQSNEKSSLSSPTSSASLHTLISSEDNSSIFWSVDFTISKFIISSDLSLAEGSEKVLFALPSIVLDVSAVETNFKNNLKIGGNVHDINGQYDRYKLFAIIGCVHLMRLFIFIPFKAIKDKLDRDLSVMKFSMKRNQKTSFCLKEQLLVNVSFNKIDLALQLADDFKMRCQSFSGSYNYSQGRSVIAIDFTRMLVNSPSTKSHWNRILCVDDLNIKLNDPHQESKVTVLSTSIRFIQPHKFVVYKLFDNISINIKIVKFLISFLKDHDTNRKRKIYPKESRTLQLPKMKLLSKKLSFWMEDDPFESELNMIYQLGILEQRKRIELVDIFKAKAKSKSDENLDNEHYILNETISNSWIRKVKVYKGSLRDELVEQQSFLFGNETKVPKRLNSGVLSYMSQPPLFSVLMNNVNLDVSCPEFPLQELPNFLNRMGQGVPVDTRYSLMIPTFVSLKLNELRIHLRDYPLPLLHIPRSTYENEQNFLMKGHLVISEALIRKVEHMRKLKFNLVPDVSENDEYHSLVIEKSLSTVKMYIDLYSNFISDRATRFVWGQSYQFGIQQAMLNFDQFSKPPVDPSLKLGFWDKMRLILHGKITVETESSLEIAFKGSRDPYDLFETASGFILSFSDRVVWNINQNDDSKDFFDIQSEKVSWYIPNYLSTGLISWSRDSSQFNYLPASDNLISSCFAYYLNDYLTNPSDLKASSTEIFEKKVLKLNGGVHFKVGFLLQRKKDDGSKTEDKLPHWRVNLYNPAYTKEGHDSYKGFRTDYIHMAFSLFANTENSYNSLHLSPGTFKQFFSWWKLFSGNMSLPIRRGCLFGEQKKSMKFSEHLSTNKFQFKFKSLFLTHIYRDDAFNGEEERIDFIGLKGKMDDFIVDLHQRKEKRIAMHEGFSKKDILKMNFNLGEVHLSGIDLRCMHAIFFEKFNENKSRKLELDSGLDKNSTWFDMDDFDEAYVGSLTYVKRKVIIHPLLYSKRFSYFRDTEHDRDSSDKSEEFGNEQVHDCLLDPDNIFRSQIDLYQDRINLLRKELEDSKQNTDYSLQERIQSLESDVNKAKHEMKTENRKNSIISASSTESFHNKFTLISMLLKWNVNSRNTVLKYIHFVQLKSSLAKYLSFESIRTLESIIDQSEQFLDEDASSNIRSSILQLKLEKTLCMHDVSCEDRLNDFDSILRKVLGEETIAEDYLIDVISPQIQLQSEDIPDSVVLIAAPTINAKIVSVYNHSTDKLLVDANELETRYGVFLHDANIFVLNRNSAENFSSLILSEKPYGSATNWPPWLGLEVCKNGNFAGKENLLVENMSMMITYEELKPLGNKLSKSNESKSNEEEQAQDDKYGSLSTPNKLHIDVPKFVITSTARQYFTLYIIVLSLLFYSEPMSKTLGEKLQRLKFSIGFQDLKSLKDRISKMHEYYRVMTLISQSYTFRQNHLNNDSLNDASMLAIERGNAVTEIYLLMSSILSGEINTLETGSQNKAHWFIRTDQLILHLLEDNRKPIIDLALAKGTYKRLIKEDGANHNRIEISVMQGFNLIPKAPFPSLLEPLEVPGKDLKLDNLITVDWSMKRSIGGIRIMEDFEINSLPINVNLDEVTGDKLMKFINQSDLTNLNPKPQANDDSEDDDFDQESEMDGDGIVEGLEGADKGKKVDSSANRSFSSPRLTQRTVNSVGNTFSFSNESSNDEYQEESDAMLGRSKKFLSIVYFKLHPIALLISIKLKSGYKRLLNVHKLLIDLPALVIRGQVLSMLDIMNLLKKTVIRTLIRHSGRLIKNKLTYRKRRSRALVSIPLRPLKKYAEFTNVAELRDSNHSKNDDKT
ncbi:uncharacterized protein PRCAT00002815001 [Priceomyces carsonii]|uniref:uncharacterized protein n=1 Tax=Priceomyces carsonii TaxID=28549 RepID=UPI002ED8AEAF|nr:unnamed protein product [Priceomyces carsonii]